MKDFLERLEIVWLDNPNLTFGELIGNVFDTFYDDNHKLVGDQEMIKLIEHFYKSW